MKDPDAKDHRLGGGSSIDECIEMIQEQIEENEND